ncbi:solute carrier family 36 (proton-coupled amino acid transporter), partial [Phenoliferia sp. Uapishka_3]
MPGLDIPTSTSTSPAPRLASPFHSSPFGSPATTIGQPTIPQIPSQSTSNTPSYGSPRVQSPFLLSRNSDPPTPSGGADLSDAEKAARVRRHLLDAGEQRAAVAENIANESGIGGQLARDDAAASSAWTSGTTGEDGSKASSVVGGDEEYPTPYNLPGGDIVAPIYKWAAQQGDANSDSGTPALRRSKSLLSMNSSSAPGRRGSNLNNERPTVSFGLGHAGASAIDDDTADDNASTMGVREILEPGGFRRDFVLRQREVSGPGQGNGGNGGQFTRSFVDFLSLYGHFGGEDLEEIDEEDEEDEDDLGYDESTIRGIDEREGGVTPRPNRIREPVVDERTPLVKRTTAATSGKVGGGDGSGRGGERPGHSRSMSRKRSASVHQQGTATPTQAVLMLLKSFVGTGVLFLGKAFYNGGIVFSTIVLCFIAMISLYSFLLLVDTYIVVKASFGADFPGAPQIGFVAAYTIFVSQNLQAFFMAVTNCRTFIPLPLLILAQLLIFLPLAMIRNIQKLSGTALIADAFILFGLVYIFSTEFKVLADFGIADIAWFNPKDFPLLIGTAVFSFEGIGLVIPITESMKDPHKFPRVLTGVMVGAMILFAGAGVLAYAAYGSAIQTVVFVNLPQDDKFVNAAQFLYSIAILLSTPLQLFPAVRIMEQGIFSVKSGKHSTKVKWEKNSFRMLVVVACSVIAWAGAADLDKFVSLIGSVACVPLCFCYPALLHYKACATTRKQKLADIALFIFGVLAAIYTTSQTFIIIFSGEVSAPPTFGKCPPRS